MMSRLLGRGLLAGLAGGLIAFAFAHTFGETPIDQAIAFEDAHSTMADPEIIETLIDVVGSMGNGDVEAWVDRQLPLLFTPDGRSYVYSYPRILSQLYVGEGLQ